MELKNFKNSPVGHVVVGKAMMQRWKIEKKWVIRI